MTDKSVGCGASSGLPTTIININSFRDDPKSDRYRTLVNEFIDKEAIFDASLDKSSLAACTPKSPLKTPIPCSPHRGPRTGGQVFKAFEWAFKDIGSVCESQRYKTSAGRLLNLRAVPPKSKLSRLRERLITEIESNSPPMPITYGPTDMAITFREPERRGPFLTMGLKSRPRGSVGD